MDKTRMLYPVAMVDVKNKDATTSVRFFPKHHRLEYPDSTGQYGKEQLTVKDFHAANPQMLQRDILVRMRLVELGLTMEQVCALDNMLSSDSMVMERIMDSLPSIMQDDFQQKLDEHDRRVQENSQPEFVPVDEEPTVIGITPIREREAQYA